MRKMAMIISLVSFVCLGAGLIIRLLSKPDELLWPALLWKLTSLLLIAGDLMLLVAILFYILRQVFPLPSGSDTPLLYSINMHNYEQSITQIEVSYNFLTSLGTSACVFVFTFFSKEFPQKPKTTKY